MTASANYDLESARYIWNLNLRVLGLSSSQGQQVISGNSMFNAVQVYYISLFVLTTLHKTKSFYIEKCVEKEAERLHGT
jgi:hypothetical protein